ncbi:ABC transporter permease [Loigolactobacillus zhaoyuanensis]|uniref:ABC transporter permease n=1 Tax=Loigolactobacillus zhaoyuanensis TaxID=2486017 RepID=A0ABW8UCU7_9LACO|nr:ABC transporter permease [Loigolactobacillus zhaoyuanensis]
MRKKRQNFSIKLGPWLVLLVGLLLWQGLVSFAIVPRFLLPAPTDIWLAFQADFSLLMQNMWITLGETIIGLLLGILLGVLIAIVMDRFDPIYHMVYPLLVVSQTVPTVAIAPLLILWLGYGMLPKVTLIIVTTFFPVAVETLAGLRTTDPDLLQLMASMGASRRKVLWYVKLPYALDHFFASLRISVTYAVIAAVVAEWVGGFGGLGVYMTRVMKAYAFDKMFAAIVLITALSLLLMSLVTLLQRWAEPWKQTATEKIK